MGSPLESLSALRKRIDRTGWFKDMGIVYHGLGPLGADMFRHFLPISAIVALYYGEEVEKYIEEEWGTKVFSYEKMNGVRLNDSTDFHQNFYRDHGADIAAVLNGIAGDPLFVSFAPSPAILEFLFERPTKCRYLQNTKIVQDFFEYKARLAWEAGNLGIPMPPESKVFPFPDLDYKMLADLFEGKFVTQIPLAAAGVGTSFIFSEEDFDELVERMREGLGEAFAATPVKVTPFLAGPSPNCTGCVVNGAVALSQPDLQIVGDPYFVPRQGQYIGSDFTVDAFTSEQSRLMMDVVRRVGEWLGRSGYRGNFGVDFLSTVDKDNRIKEIYVSEVNARLVGESQYMADFQAMKDSVPLTFFHLAEWLKIREITPEVVERYNASLPELEGSALILYTREKGTFKAEGGLTSGVYRYGTGGLERLRDGYLLSHARSDDEMVITNGVPWGDLVVGHPKYGDFNVALSYIQTRESIVDPGDYRVVSRKWREIADRVYEAHGLTPCEPRQLLKERT